MEVLENYPKEVPEKKRIIGRVKISPEEVIGFQAKIASIEGVQLLFEKITKSDASQALAMLLGAALKLNASDIHIEPRENINIVPMRVDGILYEVLKIDSHIYALMLSRI